MSTIFSRIINGEIPSYKIAENEKFYAFLDINPIQKGHTLVIPKQEIDYIFDMNDLLLGEFFIYAKKVAEKIKERMDCKRVAIVVMGLEVAHAHIHLIPITQEKDLDFGKKLKLTPLELSHISELLHF